MVRSRPSGQFVLEPPEEPIRAELFGIERLEQHAESLAKAQPVTGESGKARPLLPRVEANGRVLREAYRAIARAIREAGGITPAAEWLVDNFHVVDEQLREIRDDLPPGFYRELPKLAEGPLAGYPRVYGIAWAFVAHTDSRFDPESLRRFVHAYQRVQPLTIGELWAVAITLRILLVENLRRLAERIVRGRAARQDADALADDLLGLPGDPRRRCRRASPRWSTRRSRPRSRCSWSSGCASRIPRSRPRCAGWTSAWPPRGRRPTTSSAIEHQRQARDERDRPERHHEHAPDVRARLGGVLRGREPGRRGAPGGRRLRGDGLRDPRPLPARGRRARTGVGAVRARRCRGGRALRRARRGEGPTVRTTRAGRTPATTSSATGADPSNGRSGSAFRARVGCCARTWTQRPLGYPGTIVLVSALILALPILAARASGVDPLGLFVLGCLAVVPASDLAIALINRWVTSMLEPRVLPRLELREGVPSTLRTMVVVPSLLTDRTEVDELIERLEVHYLANPDGDVRFALLTDWTDAATQTEPDDGAISGRGPRGHRAPQPSSRRRAARRRAVPPVPRPAASGTRARARGWDGSASAGSSTSSTACCAARPTPRFCRSVA